MSLAVDFPEFLFNDVRVLLRRPQPLMSKKFLNVPQISASLEHLRSQGVTKKMREEILLQSRPPLINFELGMNTGFIQPLPLSPWEEEFEVRSSVFKVLVRLLRKQRTDSIQIFFDPVERAFPYRHDTILATLSLSDRDQSLVKVDVGHSQEKKLANAHPRCPKDFQDHPIPKTHHGVCVGNGEKLFYLLRCEKIFRQSPYLPGQPKIATRIFCDAMGRDQEPAKSDEDRQHAQLTVGIEFGARLRTDVYCRT